MLPLERRVLSSSFDIFSPLLTVGVTVGVTGVTGVTGAGFGRDCTVLLLGGEAAAEAFMRAAGAGPLGTAVGLANNSSSAV